MVFLVLALSDPRDVRRCPSLPPTSHSHYKPRGESCPVTAAQHLLGPAPVTGQPYSSWRPLSPGLLHYGSKHFKGSLGHRDTAAPVAGAPGLAPGPGGSPAHAQLLPPENLFLSSLRPAARSRQPRGGHPHPGETEGGPLRAAGTAPEAPASQRQPRRGHPHGGAPGWRRRRAPLQSLRSSGLQQLLPGPWHWLLRWASVYRQPRGTRHGPELEGVLNRGGKSLPIAPPQTNALSMPRGPPRLPGGCSVTCCLGSG